MPAWQIDGESLLEAYTLVTREHDTYVSLVGSTGQWRAECATCGTCLRIFDTPFEAGVRATEHITDGTPPFAL